MHSKMDCVSRSPLFSPLAPAVKAKLITVTHHRKFYQKGQLIRQPLDHQEGMLILDEGTAKIYALAANGKEKIIELLRSGDVVGQHWLFAPHENQGFIQATSDAWVCSIQYDDFQRLLGESTSLSLAMINNFGNQLIEAEKNQLRRDLLDAKARLMAYLRDCAVESGQIEFELPLKKKELANILGITPETLSRQFKQLAAEGQIIVNKRQITIC
ncbi:Crp/Fnr family transcriptional regulator [Lactiplantibacillus plantarum]|uniref:Crp/Fnr family transcriptional regulator n=1 Tax=Lactiplantibacillus plantarum TaxID=1590 RepID=UPI001BAE2DD9|nr:Crp/Fnr family transcriptional regulator [Lactiplantibacillus plantarum]MBS0936755.1 Crp/Fnr family transcriptional regulator [Lactiplantibacillus plantarum]MBS0945018.1 Crp/Fnr family transcriptional regulator [Lactiplantibacillus plantarum]